MDNYFDLGNHTRPISTRSDEAQTWFNRGLNWCYAFHHKEALRCFNKVVELDPECAMGYWGLAYATGPYYNIPWVKMSPQGRVHALATTYEYAQTAQRLAATNGTAVEQALCHAFTIRFAVPANEDDAYYPQSDDNYAQAMREVHAQFPDDNDVCAWTAEALMCRTPWQLWNLEERIPADGADTAEAIEIVEAAFARIEKNGEPPHPGLLHFYIHIMEMSPEPEKALPASYTLESLLPDAGHLIHMPSHIYVLCGQYERTIEANIQAVAADDRYIATDPIISFFTIYRLHNLHFQLYGATFLGRYDAALRAANTIQATITPEALQHEHSFLVNYLEAYFSMKAHVYIRFGKWQEIIDEAMPEDSELFSVTTAVWRYAKGIAYAVVGDINSALEQQALFHVAHANLPAERVIYNNESREILNVAEAMLAGELEYRRENYDVAFDHLRRSVELYDNLNYTEPWAWMQPPRHALGALLLEQGHVDEAAQIYRADLGLDDTLNRPSQHPENIWSLHGYAECLERLGRSDEAATMQKKLAAAQLLADVPVESSCFCRKVHHCCD